MQTGLGKKTLTSVGTWLMYFFLENEPFGVDQGKHGSDAS